MKSFGERLRYARDRLRLSRREVGEAIGRGERTVERWENGETKPTAADAVRVATVVGADYEWLRSGRGPSPDEMAETSLRLSSDAWAQLAQAVGSRNRSEMMLRLYRFLDLLPMGDVQDRDEINRIKSLLLEQVEKDNEDG